MTTSPAHGVSGRGFKVPLVCESMWQTVMDPVNSRDVHYSGHHDSPGSGCSFQLMSHSLTPPAGAAASQMRDGFPFSVLCLLRGRLFHVAATLYSIQQLQSSNDLMANSVLIHILVN